MKKDKFIPLTHYQSIGNRTAMLGFVNSYDGTLYAIYSGSPIGTIQEIGKIWEMQVDYFEGFLRFDSEDGSNDFKVILDVLVEVANRDRFHIWSKKARAYIHDLYELYKKEKKENPEYIDHYSLFLDIYTKGLKGH